MKNATLVSFLIIALLAPGAGRSQEDWLPADGRESLTQDLAAKLADTYLAEDSDGDALLTRAREAVGGIVAVMDDWGAAEVAARAPQLPDLTLPTSGNAYLDAIARYGACSFHLDALFGNKAIDETVPEMRVSVAVATATVPLATAMLRHHYLLEGGSDEALGAFFTSPEMAAASQAIEGNRELISYTWKECAPTIAALTE